MATTAVATAALPVVQVAAVVVDGEGVGGSCPRVEARGGGERSGFGVTG